MSLHLPLLAPPLRKEEEPHIQHKLDETDAERFNAALRFLSLANSQRFLLRETKRQRNHRLLEEIEALDIMKEYVHVHGAYDELGKGDLSPRRLSADEEVAPLKRERTNLYLRRNNYGGTKKTQIMTIEPPEINAVVLASEDAFRRENHLKPVSLRGGEENSIERFIRNFAATSIQSNFRASVDRKKLVSFPQISDTNVLQLMERALLQLNRYRPVLEARRAAILEAKLKQEEDEKAKREAEENAIRKKEQEKVLAEQRKAEKESHVKWRIAEAQRKHLERQKKTGHFPKKLDSGGSGSTSGYSSVGEEDGESAASSATVTPKAMPRPTLGTRQMSLKLAFALCKEIKDNAKKRAQTLGKMPEDRAVGAATSSKGGSAKSTKISPVVNRSGAAVDPGRSARLKAASIGFDTLPSNSQSKTESGSFEAAMAAKRKAQSQERRHTVGQGRVGKVDRRRKLTMEHRSPRRLKPLQTGRPTSADETKRERRASLTTLSVGVGEPFSSSTATAAASLMLDVEQQQTGITVGCGRRASLARRGKRRSGALKSLKRGKRATVTSPKDLQDKVAAGEIALEGLMVTGGKKRLSI